MSREPKQGSTGFLQRTITGFYRLSIKGSTIYCLKKLQHQNKVLQVPPKQGLQVVYREPK